MIRVADNKRPGVRTFYVDSGSRAGVRHTCQYIRRGGRRFWHCTCENFTYEKVVKGRHCYHLKELVQLAKIHGGVTKLAKLLLAQQNHFDMFYPDWTAEQRSNATTGVTA